MAIQEKLKPALGLKITAAFLGINTVLFLGAVLVNIIAAAGSNSLNAQTLFLSGFMLVLAFFYGYAALGLWQLKSWARKLAIVLICVILIPLCLSLIQQRSSAIAARVWYFFLYLIALVYLLLRSAKNINRAPDIEIGTTAPTKENRIPVGVAIIAIIVALNSLLAFGTGITRAVMPEKFKNQESVLVMAVSLISVAILFGWIAVGLWRLKNWARIVTILIVCFNFISISSTLMKQRIFPNPVNWWHFYAYPIVLIYLFLPSVRKAFENK